MSLKVLEVCNPLKSHKTAKAFLGNPCRKQAEIWKGLEARLYSAVVAPSRGVGLEARRRSAAARENFPIRKALKSHETGKFSRVRRPLAPMIRMPRQDRQRAV
jgi:hypothetical protein